MLDLDLFRQTADMARESFQLLDRDGRFIYVNDQTCTRYGYSRDEMLARMSVTDLNPTSPSSVAGLGGGDARPGALRSQEHLRTERWCVEVSSAPIEVRGDATSR
jgi:PAS domain S-box-containing protein